MNVSLRWLRMLLPSLTEEPAAVADRLAMYGAPVDGITDLAGPLRDIRVARVVEARRHPNADRLTLCKVDAGTGEVLDVVCGASNVRVGAFYPFVPPGARLPGGTVIRRTRIRGQDSHGMLCSARELELGRDHEGILELNGEFTAGASFVEAVALDDHRIEIDVTPNRPDLLSHWGVARELSADGEASLVLAPVPGEAREGLDVAYGRGSTEASASGVSLRLEDAVGCPRYYGAVIRGVRVGRSPEWLASRLRAVGQRPINNVVDATNWVLQELGQPLHAFDLRAVGGTVVVRRARAGESLLTLDEESRSLTPDVLVIADALRPIALAGIMGGLATEVTDATTDVLLECAFFDPRTIRSGRRQLGLNTDASQRFERGVDPDAMERSLKRAIELILATAGGEVLSPIAVADAGVPEATPVRLRVRRVEQVLGLPIGRLEIESLLAPIGFALESATPSELTFRVPGHRRYDVSREVDLIEEIARRRGYDTFPDEIRPFRASSVPDDTMAQLEDRLRDLLVARGFLEARSLPLVPETDGDVTLMHPLARTESVLRRSLLRGLVRRVEANFNRGTRELRLFEIGTVFAPGGEDGLPAESTSLAVVMTGARAPHHWATPVEVCDLWDLRGIIEDIASRIGGSVEPDASGDGPAGLLAGPVFRMRVGEDGIVGRGGQIAAGLLDAPAWAAPVWGAEFRLSAAMASAGTPRFRPLPAQPPVDRDVALVLPGGVLAGDVAATIRSAGGDLLEAVTPFDVYVGQGVAGGSRSVAFRLRFRAADRTLTVAEVDALLDRILERLKAEHDAERRG